MPFRGLLKNLVESVSGAHDAVLLDWDGETVDLYSTGENDYHVKFVGAHHGVLLNAVKRIGANTGSGDVKHVVIKSEKVDFVTAPVHKGYYIVLTVDPGLHMARLSIELEKAIKKLRHEMRL